MTNGDYDDGTAAATMTAAVGHTPAPTSDVVTVRMLDALRRAERERRADEARVARHAALLQANAAPPAPGVLPVRRQLFST